MTRARLLALAALAGACTPDIPTDPIPTAMQFDLTSTPPRAPQPSFLLLDASGHINFAQANIDLPGDCAAQTALTQADCQFDKWLQTLDGFPSVSPASAPASGPLDKATLTPGENVVVATHAGTPVTNVAVSFDDASNSVTVTPSQPWALGEFYWIGVRGYKDGVRDAAGGEVVGSPTMALVKQDDSLTCDAPDPTQLDPQCSSFRVVAQSSPDAMTAVERIFQLEQIRLAYKNAMGFEAIGAAGLPKDQTAVLWGFPIHTNSVPVLVPNTAAVPHVPAANQIVVAVQGPVDPATVSAFVVTNAIKSPDGAPLVASPVSVLLTLTAPLEEGGHSLVSGFSDADAVALEMGRQGLAKVLDNPVFSPLTGVTRANIVYAYAFFPVVMP
jgi:hypothetical protein